MTKVGIFESGTGHYYFSPSIVLEVLEDERLEQRLDVDQDFGARIIGRLLERALDEDQVPRLPVHGLRPYLRQQNHFICVTCRRDVARYEDRRCGVDGQPMCAGCYVPPVQDEVA